MAGSPRAHRAVGSAMATNPVPIVVPCHRVLRTGGALGGYGGGLDVKRYLLALESGQAGLGGEELVGLGDGGDVGQLGVVDPDVELGLERLDELDEVEAVDAEVVGEVRLPARSARRGGRARRR